MAEPIQQPQGQPTPPPTEPLPPDAQAALARLERQLSGAGA